MKTGPAFPDYIYTEKVRGLKKNFLGGQRSLRDFLLPLFLLLSLGIIVIRLFLLEILQGHYYRDLSNSNRIRTVIINAPRGIIFDRNGVPLVFNSPGFKVANITSGKNDLETDSFRFYPYKEVTSHVLGYIGQISKTQIESPEFANYRGEDLVGKIGIERVYESKLRGVSGKRLVEVDSQNKIIRKLGQTDPISGTNIRLTLDLGMQKTVFNAMGKVKKGAAIVSAPNGEILALVSKPSFDANLFTINKSPNATESASLLQVLSDEENQPLINRAIQGLYPPGSTFKPIVAAAGLENKVIDESFKVEDTGIITLGKFSFSNWYFTKYGKTDGVVDVKKALKRSNDIFFYKLAEIVGVDNISEMAEKFGLGSETGIDLAQEEKGVVPSSSWKKKIIHEQWFLGDTYHYGIGQGYLLVTPLQVNAWTQAIANKGVLYKPYLLKSQISPLRRGFEGQANLKSQKFLSDKTTSLIRQGMIESCSPGGVAWPLFKLKIKNEKLKIDGKNFLEPSQVSTSADFKSYREVAIACKTGTAEHEGGKDALPHAWVTLFAPAYDPQIVVTVLAESSGEGSDVAAPIAKKILEEWFER